MSLVWSGGVIFLPSSLGRTVKPRTRQPGSGLWGIERTTALSASAGRHTVRDGPLGHCPDKPFLPMPNLSIEETTGRSSRNSIASGSNYPNRTIEIASKSQSLDAPGPIRKLPPILIPARRSYTQRKCPRHPQPVGLFPTRPRSSQDSAMHWCLHLAARSTSSTSRCWNGVSRLACGRSFATRD